MEYHVCTKCKELFNSRDFHKNCKNSRIIEIEGNLFNMINQLKKDIEFLNREKKRHEKEIGGLNSQICEFKEQMEEGEKKLEEYKIQKT